MKSIRLGAPGEPLRAADLPDPEPAPGHVVVRVTAAGICHSDAHYRSGRSAVARYPITPGHEIAGVVQQVGPKSSHHVGTRVCVHYLLSCGTCDRCSRYGEQFCVAGAMIGKDEDGGYAEYIAVPDRNAVVLPDQVADDQAAVMMCSSATSLHALRRARMRAGDTVAVFGLGGLGSSAVRLARVLGAARVFGIDPVRQKREGLSRWLDASFDPGGEAAGAIREANGGRGVDVAVELVGTEVAVQEAVASLAPGGRVAVAGLTPGTVAIDVYRSVIAGEKEMIGVSDHLLEDVRTLLEWAEQGRFNLSGVITKHVPLRAGPINAVLDELERGSVEVRTVILPEQRADSAGG